MDMQLLIDNIIYWNDRRTWNKVMRRGSKSKSNSIDILFDKWNNAAAFPLTLDNPHFHPKNNGSSCLVALHPFEIKSPYSAEELAQVIQQAYEAKNQYPAYDGDKILEVEYYQAKGWRDAMAGKKSVSIRWYFGKMKGMSTDILTIDYEIPMRKRPGSYYLPVDYRTMPVTSSFIEIAEKVKTMVEQDLLTFEVFRKYKSVFLL